MTARSAEGAVAISNFSEPLWRSDDAPIRSGVSSCLLGSEVRCDGGHERDAFLTEALAPYVEWVPGGAPSLCGDSPRVINAGRGA